MTRHNSTQGVVHRIEGFRVITVRAIANIGGLYRRRWNMIIRVALSRKLGIRGDVLQKNTVTGECSEDGPDKEWSSKATACPHWATRLLNPTKCPLLQHRSSSALHFSASQESPVPHNYLVLPTCEILLCSCQGCCMPHRRHSLKPQLNPFMPTLTLGNWGPQTHYLTFCFIVSARWRKSSSFPSAAACIKSVLHRQDA